MYVIIIAGADFYYGTRKECRMLLQAIGGDAKIRRFNHF